MSKEPWVDQDVCISCGLCVSNVPELRKKQTPAPTIKTFLVKVVVKVRGYNRVTS